MSAQDAEQNEGERTVHLRTYAEERDRLLASAVDLWNHRITYFYQHNNENVRGGVIKAILIVFHSLGMSACYLTSCSSSDSRRGESFCDAMPTELN